MHRCDLKRAVAAALLLGLATPVYAGPAINQFEIKDLQSGPGDFEFQSQNAWSTGQPRRAARQTVPGELLLDDNSVTRQREALEVQLGVTDWFRVRLGVEYEQSRLDDPAFLSDADRFGSLKFSEVSIEGVVVLVRPKKEGIGLGLLMEYNSPVHDKEVASEFFFGPIVEARTGPWSAIVNLAMVAYIGGSALPGDTAFRRDEKWDFAYFTQIKYDFSKQWALALEAYGTVDRLGNSGSRNAAVALFGDHDQHRLGPIAYYRFFPCPPSLMKAEHHTTDMAAGDDDDAGEVKQWSVTTGLGVLFGLNENTPDFTYKLSVEVDY